MLARLLPFIRSQTAVPVSLMLEAFNEAADGMESSKLRKVANEILPCAGDYLSYWHLPQFIMAEISDADALKIIEARKSFVELAAQLMPTLLSLFPLHDDATLQSILPQIEDCCLDFPIIKTLAHEKKARKEILRGIDQLKAQISSVNSLLNTVGRHLDIEFDHHLKAIGEFKRAQSKSRHFEEFRETLNCLSLIGDVMIYKDMRGIDGFIISDNRAKTRIVELVYSLSIWLQGPAFVTTPGSDFAFACVLLYELASGEAESSFAGAINKFARSKMRRELDENEKQTRWENSDAGMREYESDNFVSVKEEMSRLAGEQKFWIEFLKSKNWAKFHKEQILMRLAHIKNLLDENLLQHGPFLIWASQYSEKDQRFNFSRMQEIMEAEVEIQINMGKLRRQKHSD